jgi:hypothetical protein
MKMNELQKIPPERRCLLSAVNISDWLCVIESITYQEAVTLPDDAKHALLSLSLRMHTSVNNIITNSMIRQEVVNNLTLNETAKKFIN